MSQTPYAIRWSAQARKMLRAVQDARVRRKIIDRAKQLSEDPESQGKPLIGDLAGYRCVRAVGQRYRIIYTVSSEEVHVLVVAVGLRKDGSREDIYALAQKLITLRLVEPPGEQ